MVYTIGTMARRASASTAPDREPDEHRLIEAAQRDTRHFANLYENNFERVYAFVFRRVGDRHEAEDLTADVFHQALRNIGRFEWRGVPFAAWLYKIAANEIADRANRVVRQSAVSDPADSYEPCPDAVENRARLYRMVDTLPPDQRRVIVMRFAEEKSIREIAAQIGHTEGAVKQLQFRGLQNLRLRMGENDGEAKA